MRGAESVQPPRGVAPYNSAAPTRKLAARQHHAHHELVEATHECRRVVELTTLGELGLIEQEIIDRINKIRGIFRDRPARRETILLILSNFKREGTGDSNATS